MGASAGCGGEARASVRVDSAPHKPGIVVLASRRTDLVRWHPEAFVRALATRYPPQRVHTLVIWTKFPRAVLREGVREVLARYDQVVVQVTITGLGGTEIEPTVPPAAETVAALPDLIDLVGLPERVEVRLDPIVVLARGGRVAYDNRDALRRVMRGAARAGVASFITSAMSPYPRAMRRLRARGLTPVLMDAPARAAAVVEMVAAAQAVTAGAGTDVVDGWMTAAPSLPIRVRACCEESLTRGSCVDGLRYGVLHPQRLPCRVDRPSGQRELCGCTHSVDIGWYSQRCLSGCLYCYATP